MYPDDYLSAPKLDLDGLQQVVDGLHTAQFKQVGAAFISNLLTAYDLLAIPMFFCDAGVAVNDSKRDAHKAEG